MFADAPDISIVKLSVAVGKERTDGDLFLTNTAHRIRHHTPPREL